MSRSPPPSASSDIGQACSLGNAWAMAKGNAISIVSNVPKTCRRVGVERGVRRLGSVTQELYDSYTSTVGQYYEFTGNCCCCC